MRSSLLLIAILVSECCYLEAAEPESRLPPDGSWVRYRVTEQFPNRKEIAITKTVKWLRGPLLDDRPTVWLEIENRYEWELPERLITERFLLPKKSLTAASAPIRDGLRAWHKVEDGPLIRSDQQGIVDYFDKQNIYVGPLLTWLPETRRDWKTQPEKRHIEFQRGSLDCVAIIGKHKSGYHSIISPVRFDHTTECTVWLHSDIPCGFAAAKFVQSVVNVYDDGKTDPPEWRRTSEFIVQDWGDKAESAIPDAK